MLLSEWLALFHRDDVVFHALRLGPTISYTQNVPVSPQIDRMLRRSNSYADAVVVTPSEIIVVEATCAADPGAISQVQHYVDLVPGTPELAPYMDRQIAGLVLYAVDKPAVAALAARNGIRYQVWTPTWIEQYLRNSYFRMGDS